MSSPLITVTPETPIRQAAAIMRENDIGVLPVLDQMQAVGIVTDRDMVICILAGQGNAGDRPVSEAMSSDPISCRESQSIAEAAAMMGDAQVERLLVVDQQARLVGVITVGDIAVNASEILAGQVVGEICEDRGTGERGHGIKLRE
ncbi:CBS domain-containing protein [Ruegeria marina]|nr:CBS domain-containing protein [Ruegeria marina]